MIPQPSRPCPCGKPHLSPEELRRQIRRDTIRDIAWIAGAYLLLGVLILAVGLASGELP